MYTYFDCCCCYTVVEYHFGQNKSERWIGKLDLKKAKEIYLNEVEKAGVLSKDEMSKLYVLDII